MGDTTPRSLSSRRHVENTCARRNTDNACARRRKGELKRRHFNVTCPECSSSDIRQASTRKQIRWFKCQSCGHSFKSERFKD